MEHCTNIASMAGLGICAGTTASDPVRHGEIVLGGVICLAMGRLHEVMGNAAEMFAVFVAARVDGPVVWIGTRQHIESLAPTGLQSWIDPARIILVEGGTRKEVLWAAEQALRTCPEGMIVIELRDGPGLRESLRLQTAAGESGRPGIILIDGTARTSAAQTRWLCNASRTDNRAWTLACIKNRRGETGTWHAVWTGGSNAQDSLLVVPESAT